MIAPQAGVAHEGKPFIFLSAFAAFLFALLDYPLPAIFFLLVCAFTVFRDPERVVPDGAGLAVSPADGRVIKVLTRQDPVSQEERTCICIFMNLFNVHVNRVPVKSTVVSRIYHPGAFVNASFDKASELNERLVWVLDSEEGERWYMVQIAGLVARRIVARAEVGDRLERGERVGIIRFGSRVDLYLPAGYHPNVREGECVFAGQTVVAKRS